MPPFYLSPLKSFVSWRGEEKGNIIIGDRDTKFNNPIVSSRAIIKKRNHETPRHTTFALGKRSFFYYIWIIQ